jgi:cardiolipin synthase A/B
VRPPVFRLPIAWLAGAALLAACEPPLPSPPPSGASSTPSGARSTSAPAQLLIEPDAGAAVILDLIGSARASLWMEMYLLTASDAISALAARAAAGCDVRVILEPAPYQDAGANQAAFDQLASAGVAVRWSTSRFTFTHAKAFTIDHARLVILTLNLTGAGLSGNREYAAVDDDPIDVASAEATFTADELGAPTTVPGGRLVTSPESTRPTLLALIAGAHVALALETEELTDPEISSALLAARARGVAVTLTWPGPASAAGAPFRTLAAAGTLVRAVAGPPIHGKVAVADARTLYVGSANLTPTSLDDNREMGVLLEQPAVAAQVAVTVAGDAASGSPP